MGIVCSTDDTASWTKTFKSNEAADADPFAPVTFGDNGDTANGSGFKFPLVISTSIKAKALIGRINNKNIHKKFFFIFFILTF